MTNIIFIYASKNISTNNVKIIFINNIDIVKNLQGVNTKMYTLIEEANKKGKCVIIIDE